MAVTNITPVPLVLNVASASILDAGGTVASAQVDGWAVAMAAGDLGGKGTPESLVLKIVAPAGGDTVLIKAGAKPPSERGGLGDLSVAFTASQVKYLVVEGSRFSQADGTIKVIAGNAATTLLAFGMPRESGRGGG